MFPLACGPLPGEGGGVVDAGGNLSYFPYAFQNWDWPEGPLWNGDLFDEEASGDIWRVKPDGTASLFATGMPAGGLLACGGHLWIMRSESCARITPPARGRVRSRDIPEK